jgi:Tol biopolymer transport system component
MLDLFSPLRKGKNLINRHKEAEAKEFFAGITAKKPRYAEAFYEHGRCCFLLSQMEEAKASLHKALELKSTPGMLIDILELTNWRMICSHQFVNRDQSFSADSTRVAYVSARQDTNGDGKVDQNDCGGIYIADLEKGEEQYIVSDAYFNTQPLFSPDGKKLMYLSVRAEHLDTRAGAKLPNPGLYLLDLATGQETQVLDSTYRIKYFSFLPSGDKLLLSGWVPGAKNSAIYLMDLKTRKIDEIVSRTFESTFPSISPQGDKLVYASWRKDTNGDGAIDLQDHTGIFIKDLNSGAETVLMSDKYNNSFPIFSPDGNNVAYLSVRRDTDKNGKIDNLDNAGIYIVDIETKKEYCLVDDHFFNKFHSYTADGKRLLFVSNWREEKEQGASKGFFANKGIYITDIDGREMFQVVSDRYYGTREPVVAPSGDSVVYLSWRKGTNRGLYLANLNRLPPVEELHSYIDINL